MKRSAVFGDNERYRYSLKRDWDKTRGRCLFILLNPSTADETTDDPTVRRCVRFAKNWGYGRIEIVNLFALRATSPRDLYLANDPVGEHNFAFIDAACLTAQRVLIGWGNHGYLRGQGKLLVEKLLDLRFELYTFGKTKAGQPCHPLYLRSDCPVQLWEAEGK